MDENQGSDTPTLIQLIVNESVGPTEAVAANETVSGHSIEIQKAAELFLELVRVEAEGGIIV